MYTIGVTVGVLGVLGMWSVIVNMNGTFGVKSKPIKLGEVADSKIRPRHVPICEIEPAVLTTYTLKVSIGEVNINTVVMPWVVVCFWFK